MLLLSQAAWKARESNSGFGCAAWPVVRGWGKIGLWDDFFPWAPLLKLTKTSLKIGGAPANRKGSYSTYFQVLWLFIFREGISDQARTIKWPVFWMSTPQNKAFFQSNKGHLPRSYGIHSTQKRSDSWSKMNPGARCGLGWRNDQDYLVCRLESFTGVGRGVVYEHPRKLRNVP